MNRLEQTLKWVNKVRVGMGRKPIKSLPKGKIGSAMKCPIALALGAEVGSGEYIVINSNGIDFSIHNPPASVVKFVEAFDDGKYPELEK